MVGSLNLIAGAGVALGFLFGIVGHHWAHALVALAGPAATAIIAAVSAAISRAELHNNIGLIFGYIMLVNSFLTVVELLPIPGRDGGRVLVRFLSPRAAMKFEELVQYELLFLLVLFLFLESVVVHMTDSFRRLIGA